jgi:hypothetical protein
MPLRVITQISVEPLPDERVFVVLTTPLHKAAGLGQSTLVSIARLHLISPTGEHLIT